MQIRVTESRKYPELTFRTCRNASYIRTSSKLGLSPGVKGSISKTRSSGMHREAHQRASNGATVFVL